jgi:adenylate cyclase class IV
MPRNIEIKAQLGAGGVAAMLPVAQALADGPPESIAQDDHFFACAQGRLKLRRFASGDAELIFYERADSAGPKLSDYVRVPVPEPSVELLEQALVRAHGSLGRVRKQRWLLRHGRTRIHLDAVAGLGEFLELEVVLNDGEAASQGQREAQTLMQALGIPEAALLEAAYLDLIQANAG